MPLDKSDISTSFWKVLQWASSVPLSVGAAIATVLVTLAGWYFNVWQVVGIKNSFPYLEISKPFPELQRIEPQSALPGEIVTLYGAKLEAFDPQLSRVVIGSVAAEVQNWTRNEALITVKVPEKLVPGRYPVSVQVAGRQSVEEVLLEIRLVPLPRPVPGRFSIAVAHLENDQKGEEECIIIAALNNMPGVQVLQFDRVIAPKQGNVGPALQAGHEQARALLAESTADVLIWGTVLRHENRSAPYLYWTTARRLPLEERSRPYRPTEELLLPPVFRDDLTSILDLLVLTNEDLASPRETYTRGDITTFIERAKQLFARESPSWQVETRCRLKCAFADLNLVHGIRDWKNEAVVVNAQAAYSEVLGECQRASVPLQYDHVAFNLAMTHWLLGERKPDSGQLEKAARIFRSLADAWWGSNNDWYARAKIHLGHILKTLGNQESGTTKLKDAVKAYVDAAYEVDQQNDPALYREMVFNRAEALRIIGERDRDTARLREAIPAYRALLELYGPSEADLRKQVEANLKKIEGEIQALSGRGSQ